MSIRPAAASVILLLLSGCHPLAYAELELPELCVERVEDFEVTGDLPGVAVSFDEAFDEEVDLGESLELEIAEISIKEFTIFSAGDNPAPLTALESVDVTIVPLDPAAEPMALLEYTADPAAPASDHITMSTVGVVDLRSILETGGFNVRGSIQGSLAPSGATNYTVGTRLCLYLKARVDYLANLDKLE